jgi:hypothetical protein
VIGEEDGVDRVEEGFGTRNVEALRIAKASDVLGESAAAF